LKILLLALCATLLFFGCAGKKQPTWLTDSESYMEKLKISKLSSTKKEANIYKQKAISSVKQSGNIEYLQIVELTDAAMDVALLNDANFTGYDRLSAIETIPVNKSYKAMLINKLQVSDLEYLNKEYKPFAKELVQGSYEKAIESAKTIKNDISKLIALGILAKANPEKYMIYEEMLQISKPNGYKNITIAAMARLVAIYQKNGEMAKSKKLNAILEELKR
jgi:hypothetical protein